MKTAHRKKLRRLLAPAAWILAMPVLAAVPVEGKLPVSTTATVITSKSVRNKKHKIRFFSANNANNLLFTVDGTEGKIYKLYIFDLEGRLITQASIHNRETSLLNYIPAGGYLFDVFTDDKKIESGQLTLK